MKICGIGREFGTESFDDYFNTKSVMVETSDDPFDWYRDTARQKTTELALHPEDREGSMSDCGECRSASRPAADFVRFTTGSCG